MKIVEPFVLALLFHSLLVPSTNAQVATGGAYTLERAALANGGGTSSDPINDRYQITGTNGQAAAGDYRTGGGYAIRNGFWTPVVSPTLANATISGRVLSLDGLGLRNATVTLIGGQLTSPRSVLTSGFGYFTFDEIEPGQIYLITVTSKRFAFAQPSQAVAVFGDVTGIVFQAAWIN